MLYPRETIEDVRHRNDIADIISGYVRLTNRGGRLFGLCPFHREKTPSFAVLQDRQMYHCFGCGASGNVISFVMQIENYAFLDALRVLADRVNYTLPESGDNKEAARSAAARERILQLNIVAARYFYDALQQPEGAIAREYLDRRKVDESWRRRFGLGFAPAQVQGLIDRLKARGHSIEDAVSAGVLLPSKRGDGYYCRFRERLIFPIIDVRGKVVGFGGRILKEGEPKYLNSQESPAFNKSRNLYGLNLARKAKSKEYILVEGYMDVIGLHQAGFFGSVAALGTAFNADHAKVLKKYAESVVIAFDSDTAGARAAVKAIPILTGEGLRVRVLNLREAKDPDDYIKMYGAQVLADELKKAIPQIMFQIEILRQKYDITDIEGKVGFLREASELLALVGSDTERHVYINAVAQLTGIDVSAITKEVGTREAKIPQVQFNPVKQKRTSGDKSVEKRLENAKKNLIYIVANDTNAAKAIEKALTPQELCDSHYEDLLVMVLDAVHKGQAIVPADLISLFDDLEAQRKVSDVFATSLEIREHEVLEKSINEYIQVIKKHNIQNALQKLATTQDESQDALAQSLQLYESRRNLEKLYITISDG